VQEHEISLQNRKSTVTRWRWTEGALYYYDIRKRFILLHFRNIRSRSRFETLAENSWPLTSDVVSYIDSHCRLQQFVANLLLLPA